MACNHQWVIVTSIKLTKGRKLQYLRCMKCGHEKEVTTQPEE